MTAKASIYSLRLNCNWVEGNSRPRGSGPEEESCGSVASGFFGLVQMTTLPPDFNVLNLKDITQHSHTIPPRARYLADANFLQPGAAAAILIVYSHES